MNTLSMRLAVGLVTACVSVAAAADTAPTPRRVYETPREQADAYRALFEKVGRTGLPELAKGRDTSLALAASWELHKKVVPRAKKRVASAEDTYDPGEVKKFLGVLKERAKAPIPGWWEAAMLDLEVRSGTSHHLAGEYRFTIPGARTVKFGDLEWRVRESVALTLDAETVSYKSGSTSLTLPKSTTPNWWWNALADTSGGKITCLAPHTSKGGFGFPVIGFESGSGKHLWSAQSWATDRTLLTGPTAGNRVELVAAGDAVFVFGAEIGGAYVEGFDLATGKCLFRFCTSYWGNFPEGWDIK